MSDIEKWNTWWTKNDFLPERVKVTKLKLKNVFPPSDKIMTEEERLKWLKFRVKKANHINKQADAKRVIDPNIRDIELS